MSAGLLNFYKDNEEEQRFLHSAHIDANKYMLGVMDRSKTLTAPGQAKGTRTYFQKTLAFLPGLYS